MSNSLWVVVGVNAGEIGEDIPVRFHIRYTAATPDIHYLRNGDPGYQGDPAECEIIGATLDNGTDILVLFNDPSDSLFDKIIMAAEESMNAAREETEEDRAAEKSYESAYDRRYR